MPMPNDNRHHVVIIGGGFAGLSAARRLGYDPRVRVTLLDKCNFHLFQPLLYQVATGQLSPGDIASPLRAVLCSFPNVWVRQAEVVDIDPEAKRVILTDGELAYDSLIVAAGATKHYAGKAIWSQLAPTLKDVQDAQDMRHRILTAFERAEYESKAEEREAWMTFVVVGGGPTGVELAGALGDLTRNTLRKDFRNIRTCESKIVLVEGLPRILPTFPESLSEKAKRALGKLGVEVRCAVKVTDVTSNSVVIEDGGELRTIHTHTVLWAAGVLASPLGKILSEKTGIEVDRLGRIAVEPDLTLKGHPEVFVTGDLALYTHGLEKPLPGLAQVALQGGRFVADTISRRIRGKETKPKFHYADRGQLAVIGRNRAVADFGFLAFDGFAAWIIWVLIHIMYLIGFGNKLVVMIQWGWNYISHKRGARLVLRPGPVHPEPEKTE
jgi:NADH dehydrogenase